MVRLVAPPANTAHQRKEDTKHILRPSKTHHPHKAETQTSSEKKSLLFSTNAAACKSGRVATLPSAWFSLILRPRGLALEQAGAPGSYIDRHEALRWKKFAKQMARARKRARSNNSQGRVKFPYRLRLPHETSRSYFLATSDPDARALSAY